MISNDIPLPLRRGTATFKELSFIDYKNICKMLISTDVDDINICIEKILARVTSDYKLNIIDKFEALIYIRNSIIGNNLTLTLEGKEHTFSLQEQCIGIFQYTDFEYGNCKFRTPCNFINHDIVNVVADYFAEVNGNDLEEFSVATKSDILKETNISILKVTELLKGIREENQISILNSEVDINVYSSSILSFIRVILYQDLMELYEFEYNVLRHLQLTGDDLKYYTLPELKIHFNFFNRDQKQKEEMEKSENSGSGETIE